MRNGDEIVRLKAKDINEIMVNGCNQIYVESNGKIIKLINIVIPLLITYLTK